MNDKVSEKAIEHAKAFLSGLFMGLRTARIHDQRNQAFERSVQTVHEAASKLFAASGGFQIQFVEQSVFLNGARLRFDGGLFENVRTLEGVLRSKELGGLSMSSPPSFESVRALVVQLAKDGDLEREVLESLKIRILGPQVLSDRGPAEIKVDRKLLAVQSYAKLLLALREQFRRIRTEKREGQSSNLRLRVVRIVQDLVEIAGERPDLLLRLSSNVGGAEVEILHGVNATLLALVMGHALGLGRRELVDLAMGTLFHHIGAEADRAFGRTEQDASLARVLADSAVSRSSMTRAIVVAHHRKRADGTCEFRRSPPHLLARIAGVAISYSQLLAGYGLRAGRRAKPLDALRVLLEDETGRFDPDLVDLLINVLRAFPVGCHVVLDSGEHAVVTSHAGGSRWDRPVVAVRGANSRHLDLMAREDGRLPHRIAGTARLLGVEADLPEDERAASGSADGHGAPSDVPEPPRAPPPMAADSPGAKEEPPIPVNASGPVGSDAPLPPGGQTDDLDRLFKEFLADDARKKPSVDTSYSSSGDSD